MNYPSIRIEGSIVSPELFDRLEDLPGQRPVDFGLAEAVTVKDEIARVWADAQDYWRIFQRKLETMPASATSTTETRNLWMVPLLGLLGYQLEYQQRGPELNAKAYPISHRAVNRANTSVHIVGYRDSTGLDRKPERSGGPRMSAHALVQEYLNLSEQLYGVATNGRLLRLLRDSSRLVKLTYLEFDLDRIFNDGLFADFAVLYRLLHATRLPSAPDRTAECLIERYHQNSVESGARIRDGLSLAVERTLENLANGFLSHPKNEALRVAVGNERLTAPELYQHLLRLIYRLLFLFVVEERDLVYPAAERVRRELYYRYYSLQRLRRLARKQYLFDHRHSDAWQAVLACFRLFETGGVGEKLGIAPLAGRLFSPDAIGSLRDAHLDNATMLAAFDALCTFEHPETRLVTVVNYGALATEEFGSVYERLLELHPVFLRDGAAARFAFKQAAGNERKTSGSYYTPSSLVECLLDSALDPVVSQRLADKTGADAERAILAIRVCDPACGSGHFLIAAAQRLGRRLATLRARGDEPSLEQQRHALREVISHCIYGVDLNPMAVELCKVTLWLEATQPGKPLSFLDHHIQCGNSLLGATPKVLYEGLPDEAFNPLSGDDPEFCKEAKKRNKDERKQLALFHGGENARWEHLGDLPAAMLELETMSDDNADALHRKEQRYSELVHTTSYENARFLADAWCAAFVWMKCKPADGGFDYAITNDVLRRIERNSNDCAPWMRDEVERLRIRFQFFHWHLSFPDVFALPTRVQASANEQAGWIGGFDVVLGNPPWERVKLQEKEWFAERSPKIAAAPNASSRKQLIDELKVDNPALFKAFGDALRQAEGESHLLRNAGLHPLCARGDINLYAVFAETLKDLVAPWGRIGCIVQSDIVTNDTCKLFFERLTTAALLVSFHDFVNTEGIFPAVHRTHPHFCLLTFAGRPQDVPAVFSFWNTNAAHLGDQWRHFTLTADDIKLLNPNSRTCPIFRSSRDAELTKAIYRRVPVLIQHSLPQSNPWGVRLTTMFHMSNDAHMFRTRAQLEAEGWTRRWGAFVKGHKRFLRLYEGRLGHQFNHRFALEPDGQLRETTGSELSAPEFLAEPQYWVDAKVTEEYLGSRQAGCTSGLLGFRRISNSTNERTSIATVLPWGAASYGWILTFGPSAGGLAILSANYNSFVLDYLLRNSLSQPSVPQGTFEQLPVIPPLVYEQPCGWEKGEMCMLRDWFLPRVLELVYTAWDLESFAQDCGWCCPPFVWDEKRRFQLRCELDAALLHLYKLGRDDAAHILDSFPIVRRKDESVYGCYRTKDTILTIYDQLAEAERSVSPFVSPLNPAPADREVCHPRRKLAILAFGSLRQDPGKIGDHVDIRIKTKTPFGVEYGRLSQSRGGGPTLVPHEKGAKVEAELLVLPDTMTVEQACDLLWRRERRKEDSDETYSAGSGANAVLVKQWAADSEWGKCPWVETVLYTDFNVAGKQTLTADALAAAAIESVRVASPGKDGVSYLEEAIANGIKTPLTASYVASVLRQTGAASLSAARIFAKTGQLPVVESVEMNDTSKVGGKRSKKVKPPKAEPTPALELNLGLDVFDNVVAPSRSWEDAPFAIPAGLRHGALPEDLYARQCLFALFALNPAGLTGSHISDSFRLLLNRDSRKIAAQSGDKQGGAWAKAFNQPVQLSTFFAALLQRAANHELILQKDGSEIRLKPSPGWSESPSDWLKADAEITQRALRDKDLHAQLLPFIAPTAEVAAFTLALSKMA